MLRTTIATLMAIFMLSAHAAIEINQATQAELETVKGIGTSMSAKVLDARQLGAFKDWADVLRRVKGVGAANAKKLSADGLTVNGASYPPAPIDKPKP
jgi:competence protein ComEA